MLVQSRFSAVMLPFSMLRGVGNSIQGSGIRQVDAGLLNLMASRVELASD